MSLFLGIDLGSTTSKAVLVDEGEHVVGRGITNTRANYDVAVEVARREAIADARLSAAVKRLGEHAAAVASSFHLVMDLHRLGRLRAAARRVAGSVPGEGARLAPAIDSILARLVDDATAIFSSDARDRGSFFRDLVGARVYAVADEACKRGDVDWDLLTGVYDRAILEVENEIIDPPFVTTFAEAIARIDVPMAVRQAGLVAAEEAARRPLDIAGLVGTGYGRQRLPFPKDCIRSEILCHGLGAHALFARTRTVLDIGGQDTKAIQVDENGLVTGFQMNDRCAAGCGRYLGYIADELNLGLHELGPLAMQAHRPCRITSTCTVFAGIELRELLSVGERREDILAGLHKAIVTRAMSLLARSGGVQEEATFTGGVAKNVAAVAALREMVGRHYGARTINIHPDSIYTGALGAALFARRGVPSKDIAEEQHPCSA